MQKIYKLLLTVLAILSITFSISAQNNFFTDAGQNRTVSTTGERIIVPQKFRTAGLDIQAMKFFLWTLPAEQNFLYNRNQAPIISLPMPDGSIARFHVWESSIQEPELAAKFPEIRTFAGQGIDDPTASIRFDFNPYFGFSAQIRSSVNGRYFIDPYARRDINNYISYFSKDMPNRSAFKCSVQDTPIEEIMARTTAGPCLGTQLRTYRLAFTCTGEFALAVGGGLAGPTHAAIVTGINRVTQVYEDELAVRLVLIANNNLIEYLNPATDPWLNNGSITELNSITGIINGVIGSLGYDIGHLGCTASDAGVAGLGVVCSGSKGRGLTGGLNPVGDFYYIDFVAHEMGHQFGADHTYNSNNCASPGGSYEPGGGTTIMAYAGICSASENIQPNSDPIFHALSFDQIGNFVTTGSACAVLTATGNTLPVINALPNNNISIPINTPFTLTATASDANGDAITYNWEGWDLGTAGSWPTAVTSTSRPLFRTRLSKTSGSRTFPDIRVIAANYPGTGAPSVMDGLRGEVLPQVARTMKFRLTVRDNRAGGGGVVSAGEGCQSATTFQVNAVGTTPFAVTSPNGGENYFLGSTQTITWNNAGTTAAPFNVANVRISISSDGGLTYPVEILASTPNDGSEAVTIPGPITALARIRVEAIGNIFFDISNANFTVAAPPNSFDFSNTTPVVASCPAGPSMTASLGTIQNGAFSTPIVLTTSTPPAGTSVSFSTNPVNPGSSTAVTLNNTNLLNAGNYTITVTGTAGAIVKTRDIVFTITAGTNPAITAQPANQTICVGANSSFSISSATATAFQWQVSTDGGTIFSNLSNGGVYTGVTTATLNITGATALLNNYRYRCIASTQCGSTTSGAGILTINNPPAITSSPSDITLCAGSNNTFTVVATGSGLTYQWQLSPAGCTGPWTNIPTATAASFTLTGIVAGQNNTGYRCIVTGSCAPSATSNCALLNVFTTVAITTQPSNIAVCEGSNTSFTVAGSGAGIIYQWQVSTDGGGSFTNITNGGVYTGATSATLAITGATFSLNNYRYRCQLSNATCTTPGVSNAGILTVNTLPAISTQPTAKTICVGGNTSYTTAATGSGVVFQWQLSIDGGTTFSNLSNAGVYTGVNTTTLTITGATAAMNNYRYRCIATGICAPAATSNPATLTVINPVSITTQPAGSALCSGSNTSFTVAGTSTETIVYQWQVSTDGGSTYTNISTGGVYSGATTTTLTITGAVTGLNNNRYRCQLSNTTCTAPTASNAAVLNVRQLPTVNLVASPLTSLLPGQTTTLTASPSATTGGTLTTNWLYNGAAPVPAITGNSYVVNVERTGTYQMQIQEIFSAPSLVCSNQSAIVTISAAVSSNLFIFPSPNDGRFTVSYYNNGGASTKRKIAIFDSKGANVYNREFAIAGPYTLLNINLERGSRGIYYVVVGDATGFKLADGKVHVR